VRCRAYVDRALGAAGRAVQREQALRRPLLLGVRETLPVHVADKMGELVHDGYLLPVSGVLVACVPLSPGDRAVTIRSGAQETHRIRLGDEAVPAPGPG
jgi:hypothetical protein